MTLVLKVLLRRGTRKTIATALCCWTIALSSTGMSAKAAETFGGDPPASAQVSTSFEPPPNTPAQMTIPAFSPDSATAANTTKQIASPAQIAQAVPAQPHAQTSAPQVKAEEKGIPLAPIRLAQAAPTTGESADSFDSKTLHLNPLYLSKSIEMNSFDALRHETTLDQMITLRDAINYVLDQGMQIKVSRESMNYQHWLTLSGIASFLPSFTAQYQLTQADVHNLSTTSYAKTFLTGVYFPVFQGGSVLYGLLTQRYRELAWRDSYKSTVSDVFLDVYQKYTNLLLQRVLLQTWGKSVEADEEQLRINKAALKYGTGTRYAVMQTEAQLALDRQSFLQQAVTMRQAGLALNLALNCPLSINLIPAEETLTEAPLFSEDVKLKDLIGDTLKFNPGLRQYEFFRLAADRNIQVQASNLYPTVGFFVSYQYNHATVNPAENGFALGGAATTSIASFLDSSFAGRVSNNALGQQYTFSPTSGSTSSQGANTAPAQLPAASGGTPIATVQSGSLVSSGAVAPSLFGGTGNNSSGSNTNGSLQAPSGIFPGLFKEVQLGFQMNWTLPGMGLQTVASMATAKLLARQALMQCNQEITLVVEQIRTDYLTVLADRQAIDKAAAAAASFKEALKYAKARLDVGIGTQLDVISAQKDYITALTSQAQAIVASNTAQAQLLHDMGIISQETLTDGYKPGVFSEPIPTKRRKWYSP